MAMRRASGLYAVLLLALLVSVPTLEALKTAWSHMDVLVPGIMLLLCWLLATFPQRSSKPAVVFMSNYTVWVKSVVPKLQTATSRLLVVSNKTELQEYCREVGCEFMLFPLCTDSLSFQRICKEDAAYRAQVEAVYEALRGWAPDFLVTAGFHVLPPHAVKIPKEAALNFHPSKLPLYRGGLPLQAQLLRGEERLECCVHVMTDVIDDSREVLVRGSRIDLEGRTTESLFNELATKFPDLILEAMDHWALGRFCETIDLPPGELPHSFGVKAETCFDVTGEKKRSNAGVLSRVRIEWREDTALDIERACRAFTMPGFKGLFTDYEGEPYRVTHCTVVPSVSAGSPGTILGLDGDGDPVVATVDGAVRLSLEKAPTMTVGQKFESVTLVSHWLQKPFTDRLACGRRFQ